MAITDADIGDSDEILNTQFLTFLILYLVYTTVTIPIQFTLLSHRHRMYIFAVAKDVRNSRDERTYLERLSSRTVMEHLTLRTGEARCQRAFGDAKDSLTNL